MVTGAFMPSLLIRHKVQDYETWESVFDEHEATRRAKGARGGRHFRSATDPNEVLLLLEWDDLERARLFADSDDLHEAMMRAGVTDRPDIWLLEDMDRPIG
jgi:heme-degrading monooxygenase HmoA